MRAPSTATDHGAGPSWTTAVDLAGALAAVVGGAIPVGGAAALLSAAFDAIAPGPVVVDLAGLLPVGIDGDVIGAGTTLAAVAADEVVRRRWPAVALAAQATATAQVRALATLGGTASARLPSSDLAAALAAHGAEVLVALADGTVLRRGIVAHFAEAWPAPHLVVGVALTVEGDGAYRRFAAHDGPAPAIATVAGVRDRAGRLHLWAGAVGRTPAPERIDVAADPGALVARLRSDPRASGWYRARLIASLAAEVVGDLAASPAPAVSPSPAASPVARRAAPVAIRTAHSPSAATVVDGAQLDLVEADHAQPLAEVLRAAGHLAVKVGCGEGTCGACTVVLDGIPVVACLVPAGRVGGRRIETARGLAASSPGDRVAGHLAVPGALQCGFCTPGIVATVTALLRARPDDPPDAAEVRAALDGHLCRCTGYAGLVDAVLAATCATAPATPRVDGLAKATGSARFAADAVPAGHLCGIVLTSRTARARVTIGPGNAMQVPGAVCVLGPDDAPPARFCTNPHVVHDVLAPLESAVFASEARHVGEIVGVVVAETLGAAREMARRVEQVEQTLPFVLAAEGLDALDPGLVVDVGDPLGDVERALDLAAATELRVLDQAFVVEPGPVGALERVAAAARWDGDRCTIWSTSQTPQLVATRLATLLGLPAGAAVVEPVLIGGGFGLKEEMFLEPLAAVASRSCGGRAVLVELSRAQLDAVRRRHGVDVRVRTALGDDGAVVARSVTASFDAGATVGHSVLVASHATHVAHQAYRAGVAHARGRVVHTNATPSGAFRGYGTAELGFAIESHVDDLARLVGVDPLDYRRTHAMRAGAIDGVTGLRVASLAVDECLDALVDHGWRQPRILAAHRDPRRWRAGRGMAMLGIVSSAATVGKADRASAGCRLERDGTFVVETAAAEMGTGNHTAFARIAAQRLGVPVRLVRVEQPASDVAPPDDGTYASRSIYVSAGAIDEAAARLRDRLLVAAAELAAAPASGLDGRGVCCGTEVIAFARLAPLRTVAEHVVDDSGLVVGAQMIDVAVDTATGRIVVDRVVSVHDVGRVVHPALAAGQVVGGVVQGVGIALQEVFRHDAQGRPVGRTLLDAVHPRASTAPLVVPVFVGDGRVEGRLGAKGLGEAPLVGVLAAIGNAVRDATGVRLRLTPFLPERVLDAMDQKSRRLSRSRS